MSYIVKSTNGVIRSVLKIANNLGIKVYRLPRNSELLQGRYGISYIDTRNEKQQKVIIIADELPREERRLTLTHELAHFVLGHLLGDDFTVPYDQREFEAEALGFILYNFLYGIDGGRKENS